MIAKGLIRKGKRFLKLRKNQKILKKLQNESWMQTILKCQEDIASLEPVPLYVSTYRKREISYWTNIPKWIVEDWNKADVKKCLDIGGGFGTLALFCKKTFDCEVHMIDSIGGYISKALLKKYDIIHSIYNIELDQIPSASNYDIIIFTEVLEHFDFHPVPTLKKISSLLSENGRLYLSTPDASEWGRVTKIYSSISEMPTSKKGVLRPNAEIILPTNHIYQYNKYELFHILDEAGFKIEKFDYATGFFYRHFNLVLSKK